MTDIYADTYGDIYGEDGTSFPANPLDLQISMHLQSATYPATYGATYGTGWQDVTQYAYQRDGESAPVSIASGRPDETATATPASMTLQLNNRDARFTIRNPSGPWYGQFGRNTPIRASVPSAFSYLRIADDQVSLASCSDSAALQAIGSPDIRIDLDLDSWVPCVLASKWGAPGGWVLSLNGDGSVLFTWTSGGVVSQASTSGLGLPVPLGRVMIRALLDITTGNLTVWTAPSMSGTQTVLAVVAGAGATSADGAAGARAVIGYNAWFSAAYGTAGLAGMVYEAQIWSASASTPVALLADPVFTEQAAGTATFADGQGNLWSTAGSAEISGRTYWYHGEMSSLPGSWDPTGSDVFVPLASGGILRRLQQGNSPAQSAFRRFALALTGPLLPVAWWPCEDGQDASQIASGIPAGFPMLITGNPSLAADSSSFLSSAPLPQVNGSQWSGLAGSYTDTGTIVVRFALNMDTALTGITGVADILSVATNGTFGTLDIAWVNAGPVTNTLQVFTGNTLLLTATPFTAADPVLVSLELTSSAGTVNVALNALTASGVYLPSGLNPFAGVTGSVTRITVNPDPVAMGGTTIGQITVQSALQPLTDLRPLITAYTGETAGNRFARLCSDSGIQSRVYGYPDISAVMGPQTAGTISDLLQECEAADRGLIFEPREVLGLGYRTLASMLSQAPAVTFDYAQAHLGLAGQPGELIPTDDDQFTINDVTLTRGSLSGPTGSTVQVVLDDGSAMSVSPPPGGVGDYSTSLTVNVQKDSQLQDTAGWMVRIGTTDEERYPAIPVNLARSELSALTAGVLAVRIGDTVAVENPPAWLPPGTITQKALGYAAELGGFFHQLEWNTVPGSPYQVMVADDPVYGRADTDGSELAAAIGTADTVIGVVTTGPSGYRWTIDPADFPFDIAVGGEQVTVTAISGTGTSQSFTVVRSVNGVVKGHGATEDVRLFFAPIAALV